MEACLENRDRVLQNFFPPNASELEFNLLLARLGVDRDRKAARIALAEFIQYQEDYSDLYRATAALSRDLSHPLRFLVVSTD